MIFHEWQIRYKKKGSVETYKWHISINTNNITLSSLKFFALENASYHDMKVVGQPFEEIHRIRAVISYPQPCSMGHLTSGSPSSGQGLDSSQNVVLQETEPWLPRSEAPKPRHCLRQYVMLHSPLPFGVISYLSTNNKGTHYCHACIQYWWAGTWILVFSFLTSYF